MSAQKNSRVMLFFVVNRVRACLFGACRSQDNKINILKSSGFILEDYSSRDSFLLETYPVAGQCRLSYLNESGDVLVSSIQGYRVRNDVFEIDCAFCGVQNQDWLFLTANGVRCPSCTYWSSALELQVKAAGGSSYLLSCLKELAHLISRLESSDPQKKAQGLMMANILGITNNGLTLSLEAHNNHGRNQRIRWLEERNQV